LWRPELSGKIAMVDSPREVIGATLKYLGASYNTTDMDSQVAGGRNAVLKCLALFQRQVLRFILS
jgi:spermidine/putrescine-binding protein